MKTELKAELLNKQGYFTNPKTGRVSDQWLAALILIDCETETEAIEIEVWSGRKTDYSCTIKVTFGEFNLRGDARGGSVHEAVRRAFKRMGISWTPEPGEPSMAFLRSTDAESVFVAIAQELGVKRPKTIRAGLQPIYRI